MKVNFGIEKNLMPISKLRVGDTFLATRTDKSLGEGLYMKIDGLSGLIRLNKDHYYKYCYAVNLETGQLRQFDGATNVNPRVAYVELEK